MLLTSFWFSVVEIYFLMYEISLQVTDAIYSMSKSISKYYICRDLHVDVTKLGKYDFNIEGYGAFTVDVIDSVKDYVELMEEIFDFSKVYHIICCKECFNNKNVGLPEEVECFINKKSCEGIGL